MQESENSVVNTMLVAYQLSLFLRNQYDQDNNVLSLPKLIPFLLQRYYVSFEYLMGRAPNTTELRFMLGPLLELDQDALNFLTSALQRQILEGILYPR